MSLREEIAVYLTMSIEEHSYKRAEDIIALLRERLTSDEAVDALLGPGTDTPQLRDEAQTILTAVCDAVLGEGSGAYVLDEHDNDDDL